jgi:hypothetical protein
VIFPEWPFAPAMIDRRCAGITRDRDGASTEQHDHETFSQPALVLALTGDDRCGTPPAQVRWILA